MEGKPSATKWQVTVLHGKEALVVEFSAPRVGASWLSELQDAVAEQSGIAVAHQKLLFKGKQLAASHVRELKDGAKLMLLKNASYHKSKALSTSVKREHGAMEEKAPAEQVEAGDAKPAPPQSVRLGIDTADIDEDHVLVQAAQGKAVYEFLLSTSSSVLELKNRVGGALGLSPNAIRLILKGKTPKDDCELSVYSGGARVLKCMVLLNARQHDLMEREEEFRVMLNELTRVQAEAQKLARVAVRNFVPREEVLIQLHVLQDRIGGLDGNLTIVEEQLKASQLLHSGSATLIALENAKGMCSTLKKEVDGLTARFEAGR